MELKIFCRYSFFPSSSGEGLISTSVLTFYSLNQGWPNQPTERPHNSLSTHLRIALMRYTYMENKGLELITKSLFTNSKLRCRSHWLRGLRRRSAAARLLILWVRISLGTWISVSCECCVLSGRGLCDELIIHPEESYRLWPVVVCDLETS